MSIVKLDSKMLLGYLVIFLRVYFAKEIFYGLPTELRSIELHN